MIDKLQNKDRNDFTIIVNNNEIICDDAILIKTMDTGADAFTAVMPWEPGKNLALDAALKPYKYPKCGIYLGGELQSEQILYIVTNKTNNSGTIKELEGYSKIADIIDSTVFPPYEENYITLTDRCRKQCKPFGINVFIGEDVAASINETRRVITSTKKYTFTPDAPWNTGTFTGIQMKVDGVYQTSKLVTDEKKFPRVIAEPTEKIFEHLSKLAAQRGLLLTCTKHGDLLITRADTKSKSIGTIEESISAFTSEYSAKFNGRTRFRDYRAIIKTSRAGAIVKTATDNIINSPRLLTFSVNDDVSGNALFAAEWRKNKSAADAMTINFPVESWYGPDGKLYKPNTKITVKSKTLENKDGFTYLITQVEFKKNATAVLQLKPPSVYGNGKIEEPWL